MRRVLHQAMTDLRAQRWLVAAWAATLVTAFTMEALKLDVAASGPGGSGSAPSSLFFARLALAMARVVLGWVLAIRIVHADPLDGTNAFWLTRPLSPRMLLAAKGGLIGVLLLAAPATAACVVLVMNGVPADALPNVLGQWLLLEALPLLPIVLVATLTRDLARMVLTLIVSFGFWSGLQSYCLFWSAVPMEIRTVPGWYRAVGRAWLVVGAGVVALCATLIARQYQTRRTARIAFAALVAALGIIAVAALWPVRLMALYGKADPLDSSQAPAAVRGWNGAAGISVTIPEGTLRLPAGRFPSAFYLVFGDFRVEGLEQDVIVEVAKGRATLRFPKEGDVLEQRNVWAGGAYIGPVSIADEASRLNFERVTGARLLEGAPTWGNRLCLIGLKQGAYETHLGSPAIYEGDLVLDAFRVVETATMPLKAGATGRAGDVQTTILAVRQQPKMWVIDIREVAPRLVLPGDSDRIVRIVRNRKRGESLAVLGLNREVVPSGLASTCVIAGRRSVAFDWRASAQGSQVDAAWLDDAELVLVSLERLGRFTKHVTVPNFLLPGANTPQAGGKAGVGGR